MAIVFPIEDALRFPLLLLEWIFAILSLELGLVFILKYRRQQKHLKTFQELGFSALFFGISLMWFFHVVADYFSSNTPSSPFLIWSGGSMHDLFLNGAYYTFMNCALIFSYFMEKYKIYLFKKYLFTYILLIYNSISLIIILFYLGAIQILFTVFWALFICFFTIYFIGLYKKVFSRERSLFNLIKALPIFLLLALSFFFSMEYLYTVYGLTFRLAGAIFQITIIGGIFAFFIKLPPLSALEWQEKLEELYVMTKSGICLYHKSFGKAIEPFDQHVISGAFISINVLLNEIAPSTAQGSSIIKKKGKTVNLYASTSLSGVLISTEEIPAINFHLQKFILKLEQIYQPVLVDWNGEIEIFAPIAHIANGYFSSP
ncbi:MAG: hypothetical protein LUQ65_06460 [Candidatus Helarchaeota archaeon]|nr:hypothetical protein [Candidatus Helarchaeota archaeon]